MLTERVQEYEEAYARENPNTSQAKFFANIAPGSRILEVGCGDGAFSAYLAEKLGCDVTGIEMNPEAARKAARVCRNVITGDVEQGAFDRVEGKFDYILFGDVLEHLVTPGVTLARSKALLNDHGYILISVPNIAHYSVRWHLATGRFEYQKRGLLDQTHLRFFTLRTATRLVEEAGLEIVGFDSVYVVPGLDLVKNFRWLEKFLKKYFSGIVGFQFIFKARPRTP